MKTITDNEQTSRDIERAYNSKKYIVAYKSVYQPYYSAAQGHYYAREIYRNPDGPFTRAGRFFHLNAAAVNHLIGFNHFAEL